MNGHRWGGGMKPLLVQDYLNPITYREYSPLGRDAGEIAVEYGILAGRAGSMGIGFAKEMGLS